MESNRISKESKLAVLLKIREKKDVLFGQLSDVLTKSDKMKEWQNIHDFSKSIGVAKEDRDWEYTRDVFWPNVRRATMNKLDNSKKTGAEGGKDCIFKDIDNIVLDIVGKDSPAIVSLGIEETWSRTEEEMESHRGENVIRNFTEDPATSNIILDPEPNPNKRKSSASKTSTRGHKRMRGGAEMEPNMRDEKTAAYIEHLKLLNEKVKVETYTYKLQALTMETELGLPPSEFTMEFYQQDSLDISYADNVPKDDVID